jgi:hypothetical protein
MGRFSEMSKYLIVSLALMGCQKARMTQVSPTVVPPTSQQVVVPQPLPPTGGQVIPQDPADIAVPPAPFPEEDEEVVIGPDPVPPAFHPSPATPLDDDGQSLDPNVFSENQQGGVHPNISEANRVEWTENNYVQPVLDHCGKDCDPKPVPKPKPQPKPKTYQCKTETLSGNPLAEKIDILFVVDTSASLKEERSQIAAQMGAFIDKLKTNVDYQIAVMPAHGPATKNSPNNFYGRLYSSGGSDAAVIKYRGIQGKNGVIDDLKRKMLNLPTDHSDAQGEVGLLGLYRSLVDQSAKKAMEREGFLRRDAALAVVFVADENDACYDYKKDGGTPNYDGSGKRDPHEQRTFDTICKLGGGVQLTPALVMKALEQAKGGMPLILTGILYTSNNIPKKSDKYAPENEMGRGYLDVIALGNGEAVNLAEHNFGSALARLGGYSQFRMEFNDTMLCRSSVNPDTMDLKSFSVTVSSKLGSRKFSSSCRKGHCPKGVYAAHAQVVESLAGRVATVSLDHNAFQKVAAEGAQVKMSFKKK